MMRGKTDLRKYVFPPAEGLISPTEFINSLFSFQYFLSILSLRKRESSIRQWHSTCFLGFFIMCDQDGEIIPSGEGNKNFILICIFYPGLNDKSGDPKK